MSASHLTPQRGSSLIEVLVAILILSFGMLALGGMMAYAVQMPKLSGYRATAAILAASHIERIRANPTAFLAGTYDEALSYSADFGALAVTECVFPNCTPTTLATMDKTYTKSALRRELPAGGMMVTRDATLSTTDANLWIIWQEPSTFAAVNATNSDTCPNLGAFSDPPPRCLYIRFKL